MAVVVAEIPGINMEDLKLKDFKVHQLAAAADVPVSKGRRDFYKMGLVNGDMTINYNGQVLEIKGNVLFFVNPRVAHSLIHRAKDTTGFACLFTEAFVKRTEILKSSPLYQVSDHPVIPLNADNLCFSLYRISNKSSGYKKTEK